VTKMLVRITPAKNPWQYFSITCKTGTYGICLSKLATRGV
jgi:hypothetical protein